MRIKNSADKGGDCKKHNRRRGAWEIKNTRSEKKVIQMDRGCVNPSAGQTTTVPKESKREERQGRENGEVRKCPFEPQTSTQKGKPMGKSRILRVD